MANTVRDIALSLGAGSLIVFTTMFGMKQCSCDDKTAIENDKKTPKVEVVNNNNIVVGGGNRTTVRNNSNVVVGDDVVVKNNNNIVVDDCGCDKDTVVVVVEPKPQPKPQPKPVVRDTVYVPVPQDTVKQVCSMSVVTVCTRGRGVMR